jgi:hypothetical protein
VPQLNALASNTGSASVTLPAGVPAGAYYLLACADDLQAVAEAIESNNCTASAATTRVGPDLVVAAVSIPTGTSVRRVGQSINVGDTTRNTGASSTGVATVTRYYLSLDAARDASDVPFAATRAVPILAAGAQSGGNRSVTIPAAPAGAYYVVACADDNRSVAEAVETNNCFASTTRLNVAP